METTFQQTQDKAKYRNQSVAQTGLAYPSRTIVHAKLEMTGPGDYDELEADAVANDIVSGGKIRRQISNGGGSGIAVSPQMERQIAQLQGGGHAMPDGLRNMMENGFGRDFSQVRLHTDSQAADMSSSISARAFTHGNDIYFNRGQFSPNTSEGQRLVAHELTHVAQGTGKVGREEDCKIALPSFESCKNAPDKITCVNDEYDRFSKGLKSKDRDNYYEVNDWKEKQIERISHNRMNYENAVDSICDTIKKFDEENISFRFKTAAEIINTLLGIGQIVFPQEKKIIKVLNPIIEGVKGVVGSTWLENNFTQGTSISIQPGQIKDFTGGNQESILEEDRIYEVNPINLKATFARVQKIAIIQVYIIADVATSTSTVLPPSCVIGDRTVEYIKNNYSNLVDIKEHDPRIWEKYLALAIIKYNMDKIYNDDDQKEKTYYNPKTGRLENEAILSFKSDEHKLTNEFIETFFPSDVEKKTEEYKGLMNCMDAYNENVRNTFRENAKNNVVSNNEIIYFNKEQGIYIDDYFDSYYIDNLNAITKATEVRPEDLSFNDDIRKRISNKYKENARTSGKVYFDKKKKEYIQSGLDDSYTKELNAIIKIEGKTKDEDNNFNNEIRPYLYNKAIDVAKNKGNVYFDGKEYVQFGIDDVVIDTINGIVVNEGVDSKDNEFNSKIRPDVYNKAIKVAKDKGNVYFDGKEYVQYGIDDVVIDTINGIVKQDKKNETDTKFNDKIWPDLLENIKERYVDNIYFDVKDKRYIISSGKKPDEMSVLNAIMETEEKNGISLDKRITDGIEYDKYVLTKLEEKAKKDKNVYFSTWSKRYEVKGNNCSYVENLNNVLTQLEKINN